MVLYRNRSDINGSDGGPGFGKDLYGIETGFAEHENRVYLRGCCDEHSVAIEVDFSGCFPGVVDGYCPERCVVPCLYTYVYGSAVDRVLRFVVVSM